MSVPVQVGQTLAGKYTVERLLGVGGMGVVVAAKHIHLGERVAIKFLLPHALTRPDVVKRFLQEGQAAARMKSEHIARVRDVGTLDDGAPYLVMEYLEGDDLGVILRERGTLPIETAVGYVLEACEALADAHAAGVIHRDLKPGNLFLTTKNDGTPVIKIIDFGISKVGATPELGPGEPGSGEMTQTAVMMGSPLYMAPEQMASARDVDARSDIWSLGVILYTLVTGQPPFRADSVMQIYELILAGAPPLRAALPSAPERLEQIVFRCLKKNRNDRFDNVADLAAALVELGPPGARESAERTARILRVNARTRDSGAPPWSASAGVVPAPHAVSAESEKARAARAGSLPGASQGAAAAADIHGSQGPWNQASAPSPRPRPSRSLLAVSAVCALVVAVGVFALLRRGHAGAPLPLLADTALGTSPAAATLPQDLGAPSAASEAPATPSAATAIPIATPAPSAAVPVVKRSPATPGVGSARSRPGVARSLHPAVDPFGGSQK